MRHASIFNDTIERIADPRSHRPGGLGGTGGLGLTDRVLAVGLEFPAPCGCGPWLWAAGCGAAAKHVRTQSMASLRLLSLVFCGSESDI